MFAYINIENSYVRSILDFHLVLALSLATSNCYIFHAIKFNIISLYNMWENPPGVNERIDQIASWSIDSIKEATKETMEWSAKLLIEKKKNSCVYFKYTNHIVPGWTNVVVPLHSELWL